MLKQEAIERFGEKVVDDAESNFETDFDKDFWGPELSDQERLEYFHKAKALPRTWENHSSATRHKKADKAFFF